MEFSQGTSGIVYIPPMDWNDLRHGNAVVSIQRGFSSLQPLHSFFSGEVAVRLELRIFTHVVPSSSLYDPWWPSLAEWTADRTVFFRLSQMPYLVDLIRYALLRDGRVFGGGDDDLPEFLACNVSSFLEFSAAALGDAEFVVNVDLRLLVLVQPALELATEELTASSSSSMTTDIAGLLRKVAYKNEMEEVVTETACPICLQDFRVHEEVHLTRCGHPFHLRCLQRWAERNAVCPLCRTAMSSVSVKRH